MVRRKQDPSFEPAGWRDRKPIRSEKDSDPLDSLDEPAEKTRRHPREDDEEERSGGRLSWRRTRRRGER